MCHPCATRCWNHSFEKAIQFASSWWIMLSKAQSDHCIWDWEFGNTLITKCKASKLWNIVKFLNTDQVIDLQKTIMKLGLSTQDFWDIAAQFLIDCRTLQPFDQIFTLMGLLWEVIDQTKNTQCDRIFWNPTSLVAMFIEKHQSTTSIVDHHYTNLDADNHNSPTLDKQDLLPDRLLSLGINLM
jgi:hypothetical protein